MSRIATDMKPLKLTLGTEATFRRRSAKVDRFCSDKRDRSFARERAVTAQGAAVRAIEYSPAAPPLIPIARRFLDRLIRLRCSLSNERALISICDLDDALDSVIFSKFCVARA